MRITSRKAFTLVELLVAMAISSILITVTISTYNLFRKSMALDQARSEIGQNARIALDRLSRELRQTPEVVTAMPDDPSDSSVAQPGEIEFEDGHANDLTYRRYYISNGMLKVDTKQYYFTYDSGLRVKWDAIGTSGESPVSSVISTQDIADSVSSISVYGSNAVLIKLVTADTNGQTFNLATTVWGRNL